VPREPLRIELLGGFCVSAGDRTVDESAWRLRKARALVKLLALSPDRALHRERAIEELWPDRDPSAVSGTCARRCSSRAARWTPAEWTARRAWSSRRRCCA
jgi:hypothetical protein